MIRKIKQLIVEKTGLTATQLHVVGGFSIAAIACIFMYAGWAALIGISAGIVMEIHDKYDYGKFSVSDFFYTAISAGVGATIVEIIKNFI